MNSIAVLTLLGIMHANPIHVKFLKDYGFIDIRNVRKTDQCRFEYTVKQSKFDVTMCEGSDPGHDDTEFIENECADMTLIVCENKTGGLYWQGVK